MVDGIPSLPTDTVSGCTVKGEFTADTTGNFNYTIINFKNGATVALPKQVSKDASITCFQKGDKVSIHAQNLSKAIVYGSQKNDVIVAKDCQNCIFDTSNDNGVVDYLFNYSTFNYDGYNKFRLDGNDKGRTEYYCNKHRVIGSINEKMNK